jgi:hypothetical protein
MGTWTWLIIIAVILFIGYLWYKYGALYTAINNNPGAVHAAESISRYATDIEGLIGAFDSSSNNGGNFMSRLGAFFGALPT